MANENVGIPCPVPTQDSTDDSTFDDHPAIKRPRPTRYASEPVSESPQRHRRRNPMVRRPVKETPNARSEYTTSQDDGTAEHRINQYLIKQEIGRGSFGAVHLAVDQFGNEYAVKEFSKSRLRKRAQSYVLRKIRCPRRPGVGFNSPLHRHPSGNEDGQGGNSLHLIRQEIAIMKKLHHNNLVSLIEVLDDPTEDPLYMVMEMCKKGVVMKVGLDERADSYDDERCRCWFRDLILGIEYLHAQGIVHRDIKPDNCLLTGDDVLKVVDFGVSEMFEKDSDMLTAKSAGSPAFLPPELCVPKHGDVSGKATDVWSMGVTLYCLRYGRLPFEKKSIFDLYESIRNDPVVCEEEADTNFENLMRRLLEKDPTNRITIQELREHPWVTKDGTEPLLSEQENTAEIVGPPTEEEMNSAITTNVGRILAVMKAVKNFKRLIHPTRAEPPVQSILGQEYESHFVQPPLEMEPDESLSEQEKPILQDNKSQSLNTYNKDSIIERNFDLSGYHHQADSDRKDPHGSQDMSSQIPIPRASSAAAKRSAEGTRGHARDPLEEEYPYLFIGPSADADLTEENEIPASIFEEPNSRKTGTSTTATPQDPDQLLSSHVAPVVSESPAAVDFDVYEIAYREQIEHIRGRSLARRGTGSKVYLNRRVEGKHHVKKLVDEMPELDQQQEEERGGEYSGSSEPLAGIGEKRAVPPFTPSMGLMKTQFEQQQQQQQRPPPPPLSSSSTASIPEPATNTPSSTYENPNPNSRTKFLDLVGNLGRSNNGY